MEALPKPTSATELWAIAREHPNVDLGSKTFMKKLLVQLRLKALVKTIPMGEQNYGYQLSEHYRHMERRKAKLLQRQKHQEVGSPVA